MSYEEIMQKLEELGSEQTKKIYQNHGVREPYFGVKIGELKKLVKYVKKDHQLGTIAQIRGRERIAEIQNRRVFF